MIRRTHQQGETQSEAVYSDCETYRYSLSRLWDGSARRVNFVMLNPSTATELQNDPTIERCERRARTLGYGGFIATNIFAIRETDPKAMRRASAPNGPGNDDAIRDAALWADDIVAAWGAHGEHLDRGAAVAAQLAGLGRPLFHMGLTKAGHPRHPLYLPYAKQPEPWIIP